MPFVNDMHSLVKTFTTKMFSLSDSMSNWEKKFNSQLLILMV